MKKALYLIIHLAVASLAGVAAAATVELMPDIGAMTGQGYNSAGRLAGDGITGDDVKNWLGSRADGWYTTTGNGDMRWGNATSNTEDQTINLPSMDKAAAQQLVDTAHQVCPYSNATRGNINVELKIA